jgi:hypothetical protein
MAPVAGGIPNEKEHGLVFRCGPGESLFRPGMPVYRIVGMLDEIGAFFIDESVGGHDDSPDFMFGKKLIGVIQSFVNA